MGGSCSRAWLGALLLLCMWALSSLAQAGIFLLLSEAEPAYEAVAGSFQESLGKNTPVQVRLVEKLTPLQMRGLTREEHLIVPVGMRAVHFVAQHHAGRAAVLGLMVPRVTVDRIRWPEDLGEGRLAYVYIDQPVARSLDMLATAMPERKQVGVAVSQENAPILNELRRELELRGMRLRSAMADDPTGVRAGVRRMLDTSQVILLVPDALVLNTLNLQHLLLASYRAGIPVLGFSPGLAKAGAVLSIFSSPEQIGWQGGVMAKQWLSRGLLPASSYAQRFSVRINSHVARALGLNLPSEQELAGMLGAED